MIQFKASRNAHDKLLYRFVKVLREVVQEHGAVVERVADILLEELV